MPGNIFAADTSFPQFYGEQSANEKIDVITDYLFMLLEELRYTLANMGQENFNDTELGNIAKVITDPVYLRLESITGSVASISTTAEGLSLQVEGLNNSVTNLAAYVGGLTLSVTNGAESSMITLSAKETTLSSQEIKITGMVTLASLAGSGTTIINGDNITTGKISGIEYEMVIDPGDGDFLKGAITMVLDTGETEYTHFADIRPMFLGIPTVGKSRARMMIEAYDLQGEPGGIEINAPEVHINGSLYINGLLINEPTT